jgi:hypothetical protein
VWVTSIEHKWVTIGERRGDKTDLYYLGFCHGQTGTPRLFFELHKVTGNRENLDWTERFTRGLTESVTAGLN